jgi:hypothetical protein
MTADDLALKIAQSWPVKLSLDDATAVVEALSGLGYTFVPPGLAGRHACESAESGAHLARWLSQHTPLSWAEASEALRTIDRLGIRIREPDRHPSGLKTTMPAFADVKPLGAAFIAAQQPIDMRGPESERPKRYR